MKVRIFIGVLFAICLGFSSSAETPTTDVAELQAQVARLQKENQSLRKENQKLRAQLVTKGVAHSAVDSKDASERPSEKVTAKSDDAGDYWLTTSSKKRHNSKCRLYKNTKGRPCGKDEGTPCKRCGG